MNLARLPDTLNGVCHGEAAIRRTLMARVLERFRRREPRWRQTVSAGQVQWQLTSREWEVIDLLAQGRSTSEIAERLVISPTAVRVHISSIVRKLEVPDRAAAVELFRRRSDRLSVQKPERPTPIGVFASHVQVAYIQWQNYRNSSLQDA